MKVIKDFRYKEMLKDKMTLSAMFCCGKQL